MAIARYNGKVLRKDGKVAEYSPIDNYSFAYWPFDNSLVDTLNGFAFDSCTGVMYRDGLDGSCLYLDVSIYPPVCADISSYINQTNNISFSLWTYIPLDSSDDYCGYLQTTGVGEPYVQDGYFLYGKSTNPNRIMFSIFDPGLNNFQVDTSISDLFNTWIHSVITYEPSIFKVYLNGELRVSASTNTWDGFYSSGLALGYIIPTSTRYIGKAENLRVFQKTLTIEEVLDLYLNRK